MRSFRSAGGAAPLRITLGCVALVFVLAACGHSAASGASSTRPTTDATLQIASPGPNQVLGRRVEIVMTLSGARLSPRTQTGGPLRPDRGHVHVLLDGTLVAMPVRLRETLPKLTPGTHTVQAEFVASDHLPFANRVVAAVTFDVR